MQSVDHAVLAGASAKALQNGLGMTEKLFFGFKGILYRKTDMNPKSYFSAVT